MAAAARRVCVLGGGSFGSVMTRIMATSVSTGSLFEPSIQWWVRRPETMYEINDSRTNNTYLPPGTLIPRNVVATTNLDEAVSEADVVVLAVPHDFLPETLRQIKRELRPSALVVSLVKGIHWDADARELTPLSVWVGRQLGISRTVAVLCGPNMFHEMAKDEFAEATIGAGSNEDGEVLQALFSTSLFKTSVVDDVVGVDLCGALKNVVALSCGFAATEGSAGTEGSNLDSINLKCAVMRSGLLEIAQFAKEFFPSVSETTILKESCGFGDLVLTCMIGKHEVVAKALVASAGDKSWDEVQTEQLGRRKLPHRDNLHAVHEFLRHQQEAGALSEHQFPLIQASYRVAFESAHPREIIHAARLA